LKEYRGKGMGSPQIVLFGGTTEGRALGEALAARGISLIMCVATDYARKLIREQPGLEIRTGRMDEGEMTAFLRETGCPPVVDATHPYAREATRNIAAACGRAGAEYLRLLRPSQEGEGMVTAETAEEAADILGRQGGKALLTVGSKELEAFTVVPEYRERLFARVLPMAQVVEKCTALGFGGRQLICMQGPFSHELNVAMLRSVGADWLVTKDSGDIGGFGQKLSAARELGIRMLVIRRPGPEKGYSRDALYRLLLERLDIPELPCAPQIPRFPLFVSLKDAEALVVGAGRVALRRVDVLLRCGARVTVIAPEALPGLGKLAEEEKVHWSCRRYRPGDVERSRPVLVVAATNDEKVNEQIGREAAGLGIPSSVASNPQTGSFWFPALIAEENLAVGLVSTNGDHRLVREAAGHIRNILGGRHG